MQQDPLCSDPRAIERDARPSPLASALLADPPRLAALRTQLVRDGVVVLDGFVSEPRAAAIRAAITADVAAAPAIEVDRRNLLGQQRFVTLNGARAFALPELGPLGEQVCALVSALCEREYALVHVPEVALSVNIVGRGGAFSAHYDRHELTAVLYLDTPSGGELECWPLYRTLWPGRARYPMRLLQHLTDLASFPAFVRPWLGRRVRVAARTGRLLVMWGSRTLHGVVPLRGDALRYSVQYGLDLPHVRYPAASLAKYYGNAPRR